MNSYFPLIYLSALTGVLSLVGWLVFREIRRTRKQEAVLTRLQAKLLKGTGTPEEHYELGSVYLEKRLYDQSISQFKKALQAAGSDIPVVCNGLGFAYFSQEQFDISIRYYKDALKVDPTYLIAWNNLGHAYEKKNLAAQGLEAYEAALALDPSNEIAKRRADSLRKRIPLTTST